jgi:5'-AMP-activated protein kinase catalytic alpha subunit
MPSLDDYVLGEVIGQGSFGVVRMGRRRDALDPDAWPYAVKIIDLQRLDADDDPSPRRMLEREVGILERVRGHPHMVTLIEAFTQDTHRYLVLERADTFHKDVFDDIIHAPSGRMSPAQALGIFAQVVSAVAWCDQRGIYHRDLKPENLLLDRSGRVQLIDFGLAKCIAPSPSSSSSASSSLLHTVCGSPLYASPQLLVLDGRHSLPANEVWALGVLLFGLVTGSMPFDDDNHAVLVRKICDAQFIVPEHVPTPIAKLLRGMLVADVRRRITIPQLAAHPLMRLHYDLYRRRTRPVCKSAPPAPPPPTPLSPPALVRRHTC